MTKEQVYTLNKLVQTCDALQQCVTGNKNQCLVESNTTGIAISCVADAILLAILGAMTVFAPMQKQKGGKDVVQPQDEEDRPEAEEEKPVEASVDLHG